MSRFARVPSEEGDLLINPDWVRMLRELGSDGKRTQIVFDEAHIVYVDIGPDEVVQRFAATS